MGTCSDTRVLQAMLLEEGDKIEYACSKLPSAEFRGPPDSGWHRHIMNFYRIVLTASHSILQVLSPLVERLFVHKAG